MNAPGRSGPRPPRGQRQQRVRVTSPRMGTAKRPAPRPRTFEINEQTGVGEIYMRSLMQAVLRPALGVIFVLALTLGVLPLLFITQPQLAQMRVLGLPPIWLMTMALYPVLVLTGWWLVRSAERAEKEFAEIITQR